MIIKNLTITSNVTKEYSLFFALKIREKNETTLFGLYDIEDENKICERLKINTENQLSYDMGLENCIEVQNNILHNNINIISIIRNNNDIKMFLNKEILTNNSCILSNCSYNSLSVGIIDNFGDAEFSDFNFYELLFFDRNLDNLEIAEINQYLKNKMATTFF